MVSNVGPLRTLSYNMISSVSAGGRTYVPVKPSQFVYSQFKYVAGFPAKNGQEGITVDKIKILNTLIEQLVSMKQKNVAPPSGSSGQLSGNQVDALIKQYQEQVSTVTAAASQLDYKPPMPQSGAIVNLVA